MSRKITATPDMRDAVANLIATRRITRSAYEHAVANGYTDSDVIKLAEEQRARKARLAITGNPGLYRPRAHVADNPTEPTPERMRKGAMQRISLTKELGAARVLKTRTVLDQHGDKYAVDKRCALERLLIDAQYAERVRTADLDPKGGGVPGKRLGGLGNVPDDLRLAVARHEWVWCRLPEEFQSTARMLVLGELRKPSGEAFSMEDFGGHIIPSVKDRNRRWGIAAGALWGLASALVQLYALCPHRRRWSDDDEDTRGGLET